jgi:hypothetical protein
MHSLSIRAIALLISAVSLPSVCVSQGTNPLPGHIVDIKVGEYFILAPDSIPSGVVTLRLTQTGDVTKPWPADTAKLHADNTYHFHMIWLVRLDSAKTFTDLFAAHRDRQQAPWSRIMGGPGFADSPSSSNVTMQLPPGNYALVCYVGSARENRDRYHVLKGMIRPLTVTASENSGTLPATDITIVLRGETAEMPDTLAAGDWRVALLNKSERNTDFGVARLKKGYTIDQVRAWRPNQMTEPPRHAVGGVVHIRPEQSLMTTLHLEPGDYFFKGKHVVVR